VYKKHRPLRSLGQNFLIDGSVADMQIEAAELTGPERVLEIGPGTGILSRRIIEKLTSGYYYAIEKDRILCSRLSEEMKGLSHAEIRCGDAMKLDWPKFDVMVSNIPYNISTPFTLKLLSESFSRAVVMYQKEFPERLIASPHTRDYGRLTVYVYMRASIEKITNVPPTAFEPKPEVASTIVRIRPKAPPFETDMKLFEEVTRLIFLQRRKKIKNCLKPLLNGRASESSIPYADSRAEELAPEQINEIVLWLEEYGD